LLHLRLVEAQRGVAVRQRTDVRERALDGLALEARMVYRLAPAARVRTGAQPLAVETR